MKTLFYILLLLGLFMPGYSVNAANIISTVQGGNWNSTSTWVGGVIPTVNDHVYLVGQVSLNLNTGCASLTVHTGGILQNSGAAHTLTIFGPLVNDGILRDQQTQLNILVHGNIEIRGTTNIYKLETVGVSNQNFYLLPGIVPDINYFNNTAGNVVAQSPLVFYDTEVDFNSHSLILPAGASLEFQGNGTTRLIKEIVIVGNNNSFIASQGYSGQDFTGQNLSVFGVFRINASSVYFTGNTMLHGTIENFGGSHEVLMAGDFTNYGTLQNGMNQLTVNLAGNVTNYGFWNNHSTIFSGSSMQEIWFDENTSLASANVNYSGTSGLKLISDITIKNSNVNFNYCTILCSNEISIHHTGSNVVLRNGNFVGNHSSLRLNGVYAQSITGTDLILRGMFLIGDNNCNFTNAFLPDTLANYGSNHSVVFHSDFTTTGRIFNGTNLLTVYCTGNVMNYGAWECANTYLSGDVIQQISFAPGSVFTGEVFQYTGSAGTIISNSDLLFSGTNINLNNRILQMPDNSWFAFDGFNKSCVSFTLNSNNVHLVSGGGSYLQNVTINGNTSIHGEFRVGDNNVVVNGNLTVVDTIGNYGTGHWLTINGDLCNYGLVTNLMNTLNVNLSGNLINGGVFQNNENNVLGVVDEHIRLIQGMSINKPVKLHSNLGGNGWVWYKNGVPIPGASAPIFTLATIHLPDYGIYHCTSSAGQSRIITIEENLIVDFTSDAPAVGSAPLSVQFTNATTGGFSTKNFAWDFGDGFISMDENPEHSYLTPGLYDVSLTVYDGYLESDNNKTGHVFVCRQPQPDFTAENVCFGASTYFEDLSEDLNYENDLEIRYAASVTNFSSEWSSDDWAAIQILGEPNVYPVHYDSIRAWAPLTPNGPREWIELMFDNPQPACEIWIYETLRPGTIDTVYVKNPETGFWEMVWSGSASPAPLEARIFKVEFPQTSFPVSQVRIALNTGAVAYWNEIDAVAVVTDYGYLPSSETAYEWDVDGDGITDYTEKGSFWHEYQTPGVYPATLRITNNGQCVEEITKTLSVNTIPEFIQHPANQVICDGGIAEFYAEAVMSGDYGVNYIWVGPQGFMHQETQPQLVIDPVAPDDAGEYYLVAYNECGSEMSNVATLTVQQNPEVFAGDDATVCQNQIFTPLTAFAANYQNLLWESSGSGIFDDPSILHPTYLPSQADIEAGQVTLSLTAFAISPCTLQTNSSALLTIWTLPTVIQQPVGTALCEGLPYELSIGATGTDPIGFQWFGPLGLIEGAVENSLSFTQLQPAHEGYYYCEVQNNCETIESQAVFVEVYDLPTFVQPLQNLTIPTGADAVFTAEITGEPPLLLQWYDSQGILEGQTSETLVIEKVNFLSENTFYCIAENFCNSVQSNTVSLNVATGGHTQEVMMDEGWSGISSWLWMDDPTIETVLEPISSSFIIMLHNEGMYWPDMGINTINQWNNHQGYAIKVSEAVLLPINGSPENDRTIQIAQGWNLIPVLSECNMDVDYLAEALTTNLIIVKSVAGQGVFWPQFNINTLGCLSMGKAYYLFSETETTFTFPDCETLKHNTKTIENEKEMALTGKKLAAMTNWKIAKPTIASHILVILQEALTSFENNTLFGAFDLNGHCCGTGIYGGENMVITLYGKDEITGDSGFLEGEPFLLKCFSVQSNDEFLLEPVFDGRFGQNVYETNGVSVINRLKVPALSTQQPDLPIIMLYPNPASNKIHISGLMGENQIKILDNNGRELIHRNSENQTETFDISGFPAGFYMMSVVGKNTATTRRFVKW